MIESKGKKLLEILQENYEIESDRDLSSAIKDLFKDSLQEMMNAEVDSSMGYSRYDKKAEKTNYRNDSTKKTLKSEFGEFKFETPLITLSKKNRELSFSIFYLNIISLVFL